MVLLGPKSTLLSDASLYPIIIIIHALSHLPRILAFFIVELLASAFFACADSFPFGVPESGSQSWAHRTIPDSSRCRMPGPWTFEISMSPADAKFTESHL
ncbi:hypothetical protein OG21DRAFT_216277 [Imleria badia]|nr:hypothetical protein OG21DRAFT_216277 [Imleria badia]